ncbi:MAG: hypothetical protein JWL61_2376 [Gemmatimonadetes bacterium]|nr:hypothetical protein [Gemmatimonadota bacterium]
MDTSLALIFRVEVVNGQIETNASWVQSRVHGPSRVNVVRWSAIAFAEKGDMLRGMRVPFLAAIVLRLRNQKSVAR